MKTFLTYISIGMIIVTISLAVMSVRDSNTGLMYHAYEAAVVAIAFHLIASPAAIVWRKFKAHFKWVDLVLFLPIIILVIYVYTH
jgi:hypothetical protein